MSARYNIVSILLHWLVGIAIIAMFFFGLYIDEFASDESKKELIGLHKSIGMTIIIFTGIRLLARLAFKAPPLPDNMTAFEKKMAKATHALLYLLILAVPVSGWVMSGAAGYPVSVFDIFTAPALVEKNPELREIAGEAHEILAFIIIGLSGLHAAIAIFHQYVRKDGLLERMSPCRKA